MYGGGGLKLELRLATLSHEFSQLLLHTKRRILDYLQRLKSWKVKDLPNTERTSQPLLDTQ